MFDMRRVKPIGNMLIIMIIIAYTYKYALSLQKEIRGLMTWVQRK